MAWRKSSRNATVYFAIADVVVEHLWSARIIDPTRGPHETYHVRVD
jgi:hypothetical protein